MARAPRRQPNELPSYTPEEDTSRFDTSSGNMRFSKRDFARPPHKVVPPPKGSVDAIPDLDAQAIAKSIMLQQAIRKGDQADPKSGFSYLDNIAAILLDPQSARKGSNAQQNAGVLLDQLTDTSPTAYLARRPETDPQQIPTDLYDYVPDRDLLGPYATDIPRNSPDSIETPGQIQMQRDLQRDYRMHNRLPLGNNQDYRVRHIIGTPDVSDADIASSILRMLPPATVIPVGPARQIPTPPEEPARPRGDLKVVE